MRLTGRGSVSQILTSGGSQSTMGTVKSIDKRFKRSTKRNGGMCDQKAVLAEEVACPYLILNMTPDTTVVYTAYRTLCRVRTRNGDSCTIVMRVANGKALLILSEDGEVRPSPPDAVESQPSNRVQYFKPFRPLALFSQPKMVLLHLLVIS